MRRWWIVLTLAMVVAASLGYGYYADVRQRRANRLHIDIEQALQRRDFADVVGSVNDGDQRQHVADRLLAHRPELDRPLQVGIAQAGHICVRRLVDGLRVLAQMPEL